LVVNAGSCRRAQRPPRERDRPGRRGFGRRGCRWARAVRGGPDLTARDAATRRTPSRARRGPDLAEGRRCRSSWHWLWWWSCWQVCRSRISNLTRKVTAC